MKTIVAVPKFKYIKTNISCLMKPPYKKGDLPTLIIARGNGEVWHTDGMYMKSGEVPVKFGNYQIHDLHIRGARQVIDGAVSDELVTITGEEKYGKLDLFTLSDGTLVNKNYLSYVMDGFDDVYLTHGRQYDAVCIMSKGKIVGLVMPIRKY